MAPFVSGAMLVLISSLANAQSDAGRLRDWLDARVPKSGAVEILYKQTDVVDGTVLGVYGYNFATREGFYAQGTRCVIWNPRESLVYEHATEAEPQRFGPEVLDHCMPVSTSMPAMYLVSLAADPRATFTFEELPDSVRVLAIFPVRLGGTTTWEFSINNDVWVTSQTHEVGTPNQGVQSFEYVPESRRGVGISRFAFGKSTEFVSVKWLDTPSPDFADPKRLRAEGQRMVASQTAARAKASGASAPPKATGGQSPPEEPPLPKGASSIRNTIIGVGVVLLLIGGYALWRRGRAVP